MLSRKKNEVVVIGDGADAVAVMIVEIRGDKVRLGFTGPKEVPIHRQEVADAIAKAKEEDDAK